MVNTYSKLYLRICNEHIFFARYDATMPGSFAFVRHPLRHNVSLMVNMRDALQSNSSLGVGATSVEAVVVGPATLVPFAEFQQEDAEVLYKSCFEPEGRHRVFYDTIASTESALLFALDEPTHTALTDAFEHIHFTSASTSLLRHFSRKGGEYKFRFYAYLHEEQLTLMAFHESRLLTLCDYVVKAPADIAYYVAGVANQFGSQPAMKAFYVLGEEPLRNAASEMLKKVVPNVFEIDAAKEFAGHEIATNTQVPYDMVTLLLGE